MVRPHVAVVTMVGSAHMENFPDGEAGVANAKAEIFEGLEPGGVAVLNAEGAWFRKLNKAAENFGATVVACGYGPECEAQLLEVYEARSGIIVEANLRGEFRRFKVAQFGLHWAWNSLTTLLALEGLGVSFDVGIQALGAFSPLKGRGETHALDLDGRAVTLIDESYNANPISMRAALDTLAKAPPRRIAVLTDMLELGPEAVRHHAELAGPMRQADVAATYLAGPSMRHLYEALPPGRRGVWAHSAAELAPAVVAAVRPGDTVMVKGSNGSQASLIVRALLDAAGPGGGSR
jgi:UDP-N-acetylmuramoyl-tripeptide--D-alanyl-D-alanine ligase